MKVACLGTYIVDVLGQPVSELPRGQSSRILEEIRITVAGTAGGTAVISHGSARTCSRSARSAVIWPAT
jgi:hypothetical protein